MVCKNRESVKIYHGVTRRNTESHREKAEYRSTSSWCLCGSWSIFFLIVFLSCQSVPRTADAFLKNANSLPLKSGASVYIIANVRQARQIISILPIEELNNSQTNQLLNRTNFFMAGLYPRESGRRFHIAAFGTYPGSQADIAFSVTEGWQKQRSQTGDFWYSRESRLSIALSSNRAIAASSLTNQPCDPFDYAPGAAVPEGFNEFRMGAPLSFWVENPAPVVTRILSGAGVPLRSPIKGLFINLLTSGQSAYQAVIRLQFENPSHARGMAALLSLASGRAPNELASIFFANPPVQDGRNVDIRSAALSETEMVRLFRLFSLY